jgi:hypothetical protein
VIISPIFPIFGFIDDIKGAFESHEMKNNKIIRIFSSLP